MRYRTRQEIYDIVKTHAQLQSRRSLTEADGDINAKCAYRGAEGAKCFVGVLIADYDYRYHFDTRPASGIALTKNDDIAKAAGVSPGDREFASRLQHIHDDCAPSDWLDKLRALALENGLIA